MNNHVIETLKKGEPSIGTWLNLTSPMVAEIMASIGYQWLTVDGEHSPCDLSLMAHMFRAIEGQGGVPLVRSWDHDPVTLARLLDAGAYGIVIPHVSTAAQTEQIVEAMLYPPRGKRSAGSIRLAAMMPDREQWYSLANEQTLIIPQIEDMEGINNAEAIVGVEGVSIGFLGPGDLAFAMGVNPGHPEHEAAIQKFRESCQKVGKPSGLPVAEGAEVPKRIAEGFRFINISSDMFILRGAAQAMFDQSKTSSG